MKEPIHIEKEISIERRHIESGKKGDALACPVALALKEHIKPNCSVLTTSKQILYYNIPFDRKNIDIVLGLGRVGMIGLPEEAIEHIKNFDSSPSKALPFTAIFKIPTEVALTS